MKLLLLLTLPLGAALFACYSSTVRAVRVEGDPDAHRFLAATTDRMLELYAASSEAQWKASTDVKEEHVEQAIAAEKEFRTWIGGADLISTARELLERETLSDLQRRQLRKLLLMAAESPGTVPDVVSARVEAEARQRAALDGFEFRMETGDGGTRVVTPNDIDEILRTSTDLDERRRAWEASKTVGAVLKPGLVQLQELRNAVAREMGYDSFFALQVADYDMDVDAMMQLMRRILADVEPLYRELHLWARRTLAARYGEPVPELIPAHWLPNRWGQEWPGLVAGIDLDPLFAGKTPEDLIETAEAFYTSMGFPELPRTFWERSDLYELPAGAARKKNTHASAWHLDLRDDVRSLMSVKPDWQWFLTTHHELGHVYYFLAYTNPRVPPLLREGANRAFHEAVGELISLAASQEPYLRDLGVLPESMAIDPIQWLLNDALQSVVLLPWSAGVMTHFEHDLYAEDLAPDQFNARWWEYKRRFQGIAPPAPRGEELCDAATKTHVNDDPAQYYDYALATVLKFQLHDHIAREILKTDPRSANYRGNEEVGRFLRSILEQGATRDWNEVLKEATGEELSGRAMLEYFAPLHEWLRRENARG